MKNEIGRSLRNAIEHGRYEENSLGQIVLFDGDCAETLNDAKIVFSAKPSELFEIAKSFEMERGPETSFEYILEELKQIVSSEKLEHLKEINKVLLARKAGTQSSSDNSIMEYESSVNRHK